MKSTVSIATFLIFGAVAASASAQQSLAGSDTLFEVTTDMIASCGLTGQLTYAGGGSGAGENAMNAATPTQDIAPMSRALSSGFCGTHATAELMTIGLDGISILSDADSSLNCGGAKHPGAIANDWRTGLRLLLAGFSDPTANTGKDCNSAARQALINSWSSFFQSACTNGDCSTIRHFFRRADLSGTTDTIIAQLGLPSITKNSKGIPLTTPFCNGLDIEDKDPIRIPCDPKEQVCQAGNNTNFNPPRTNPSGLGFLLPINVPENIAAIPQSLAFNQTACDEGSFDYAQPEANPDPNLDDVCPDGSDPAFGTCLFPIDIAGHFGCLNIKSNFPFTFSSNQDGRIFNKEIRNASGTLAKDPARAPLGIFDNAFFRLHMTTFINLASRGGHACRENTSTEQIGCLTQASPCSLGFSGREAAINGASAILINGIAPDDARIRDLIGNPATAYPLARKLFLNTRQDFTALGTGAQKTLSQCMLDAATNGSGNTKINQAMIDHKFVTLTTAPFCQNCAGTATQSCF